MAPVRSGNPSSVRYPAVWGLGEGAIVAGEVELGDAGLRLDGRSQTGRSERSASYRQIRQVRVARSAQERLNGRPTLLLDLAEGQTLAIMPLGMGLMAEMAELLADLTAAAGQLEQIVVVVPLRPGSAERAKELLAAGPPFEPAEFELDEHEVFVGEREAVFVFQGRGVREALQQAAGEPELWRAGLAWRGLLGGRPRMIERAYHWSRPHSTSGSPPIDEYGAVGVKRAPDAPALAWKNGVPPSNCDRRIYRRDRGGALVTPGRFRARRDDPRKPRFGALPRRNSMCLINSRS